MQNNSLEQTKQSFFIEESRFDAENMTIFIKLRIVKPLTSILVSI